MSAKISELLFEENSSKKIHKVFENNLIPEAKVPETKLKAIGKTIARQIKAQLPDLESQMKDLEDGVFDVSSLKKFAQANLAGFSADFIASKKSKNPGEITGKQEAPTPLDINKFDTIKMYPIIIKDKKSGEPVEGGKGGETYNEVFFVPAMGEEITDQKVIALHKEIFEIKEEIAQGDKLVHYSIKEIPHFPLTFEQLQIIQNEVTSGTISKIPTILKNAKRIKVTDIEKPKNSDSDETQSTPATPASETPAVEEKIGETVYESAIKNKLHKQNISMLLFEKKSRLSKKQKEILDEALLLEEEALNEFIGKFSITKAGRDKSKLKKIQKDKKKTVDSIIAHLSRKDMFPTAVVDNIDAVLNAFYDRSSNKDNLQTFTNFYQKVMNAKKFNELAASNNESGLKRFIADEANKVSDTSDVSDYDAINSEFVDSVVIKLDTSEEEDLKDVATTKDVIKKSEAEKKAGVKGFKTYFDKNGKVKSNKRGEIQKDVKEAISKIKSNIPENYKSLKSLFEGDGISKDNLVQYVDNLSNQMNDYKQKTDNAKSSSDSVKNDLLQSFDGADSELKQLANDSLSKFQEKFNKACDNLSKSFEEASIQSNVISKSISDLKDELTTLNNVSIDLSDPDAQRVSLLLLTASVVEFSKTCYSLQAAFEELADKENYDKNFEAYTDYFNLVQESLKAANDIENLKDDDDDEAKEDKKSARRSAEKKEDEVNRKMSELNALMRVQNSLAKFGVSADDAKKMLNLKENQEVTLESIINRETNKLLNETTTTRMSNPNIINISGKILVGHDGAINKVVLDSLYKNIDKSTAFKNIKNQIKSDILALTGVKNFKDADKETVTELIHMYFTEEFSSAGDMSNSLSNSPTLSRFINKNTGRLKRAKNATKNVIRGTASGIWKGIKWTALNTAKLIASGFAVALGYGSLKILSATFGFLPQFNTIVASIGGFLTKVAGYLGITTTAGGSMSLATLASSAGATAAAAYTAVIGQYAAITSVYGTASAGSLAMTDPILNAIVQFFSYPFTGGMVDASGKAIGFWKSITSGITGVGVPAAKAAAAKAALTSPGATAGSAWSGMKVYWAKIWAGAGHQAAMKAAMTSTKSKLTSAVGGAAIKGGIKAVLTTGFWGPAIASIAGLYISYRILEYMTRPDEVDNTILDKPIEDILKVYVIAAAANKQVEQIANLLGITDPTSSSLMSSLQQPTQNEVNLITEFFTLKGDMGFGADEPSVKENFDQVTNINTFRTAINSFYDSFDIFMGNKRHGRVVNAAGSAATDWFRNNSRFNNFSSSVPRVDIKGYTIEALKNLYEEFQEDLRLLNSGKIENIQETYTGDKFIAIVSNALTGYRNKNDVTFVRKNAASLINTKENVIELIDTYRNAKLNSLTNLFKDTPSFDKDPLQIILGTLQNSKPGEKVAKQINLNNIVTNIDKHFSKDRVDVNNIVSIMKSKAAGITAGAAKKFFLEKYNGVDFIKGVFNKSEQDKYVKEFNKEIAAALAKSMDYCVDKSNLFESTQHPIFIQNKNSLLTEAGFLKKIAYGAMTAVGAATTYAGSATAWSTATSAVTSGLALKGTAAIAAFWAGAFLSIILAAAAVYFLWDDLKKFAKMIKDKVTGANWEPWDDKDYIKSITPMIQKAAQVKAAYSYIEVLCALEDQLKTVGIKLSGLDTPQFKDINSMIQNKKQIGQIKNSLTDVGDELHNQVIDIVYQAKNYLPTEGLGKYLDKSTIDDLVDDLLFGKESPLSPIFLHGSMSSAKKNSMGESYIYKKGLNLLLEADGGDQTSEKLNLSMNKIYSELVEYLKKYFKTDLNYDERISNDIANKLKPLMKRDGIDLLRFFKRAGQKLSDTINGKTGYQYLIEAISEGTGLRYDQLEKVFKSQGIKLKESQFTKGDLILEGLKSGRLTILNEADIINKIWQNGKNIDIIGVSDSSRGASKWFSTDGGKTWSVQQLKGGVGSYTPPSGATDVTNSYNLGNLKSTYTTGVQGPTASGGMTATDGSPMGGFDPVLASGSLWSKIFTQGNAMTIMNSCQSLFSTIWMIDGAVFMSLALFDDTLHLNETLTKLNSIAWHEIPAKMILVSILNTLNGLKNELSERGITISGDLPDDVLSNFSGSGRRANIEKSPVKQKSEILSKSMWGSPDLSGIKKNKVNDKKIKDIVEKSLLQSIIVYNKKYNKEKIEDIKKRAELGADVSARRSAVNKGKGWGLGGVALGIASAALLASNPVGWAIAGVSAYGGIKAYNKAEEGVDQIYASEGEADAKVDAQLNKMAAKEASELADVLIALTKEIKNIEESLGIKNKNLINHSYVHNKFNLVSLINEDLSGSQSANNTIDVGKVLRRMQTAGIMAFNGDLDEGTPQYKRAVNHTITTVCNIMERFFGIEVTGANKYLATDFNEAVAESVVDKEAPAGEPASKEIAQANDGSSPPSMDSKGNMNDMMQLANMSGGNMMMMFMMMMMSGQRGGGFDMMQLMQQLNGGKITIGDAASRISEEEGMEGFADAIEKALEEANGSKTRIGKSSLKTLYKRINANLISNLSEFDINKEFRKGDKVDAVKFVNLVKRRFAIVESEAADPNSEDVVVEMIEIFDNLFPITNPAIRLDLATSTVILKGKTGNTASRTGCIYGAYYLKLIGDPRNTFITDISEINTDSIVLKSNTFSLTNLTTHNISPDTSAFLEKIRDFFKKSLVKEGTVNRKVKDNYLFKENFYNQKLSGLLFEEKLYENSVRRKRKPVQNKEVNLRQEWLKIWDI